MAAVPPEELHAPTPCDGWDVRTVNNHVVLGNLAAFANVTAGAQPDREADHLGADHEEALRLSNRALFEALQGEGVLTASYHTPLGEQPGFVLATMRLCEAAAHGWDIARASGQSTDLDPEVCAEALQGYTRLLGTGERPGMPFGAEQPAPENATMGDRMAAFIGRPLA